MTDLIEIPRWDGEDGFQHYKNRDPIWIKVYTRLHSDDAWLELTAHQRAVLLGLWLEYARGGRHLPLNTASLSRRLNLRVMRRDIEHLETKGFVQILLADSKQHAMPEQIRGEQNREEANVYVDDPPDIDGFETLGQFDFAKDRELRRIVALLKGTDDLTLERLRREADDLAFGWVCRVRESIARRPGKTYGVGYAVNALRSAKREAA